MGCITKYRRLSIYGLAFDAVAMEELLKILLAPAEAPKVFVSVACIVK
jgi:hypothetical protein